MIIETQTLPGVIFMGDGMLAMSKSFDLEVRFTHADEVVDILSITARLENRIIDVSELFDEDAREYINEELLEHIL